MNGSIFDCHNCHRATYHTKVERDGEDRWRCSNCMIETEDKQSVIGTFDT